MYRLGLAENPNLNLHRRLRYHQDQRMAVHSINKIRKSLGEFHHLFQQLKDDPERFFQYTRMHRKTLNIILEAITPFIERQVTNLRSRSLLKCFGSLGSRMAGRFSTSEIKSSISIYIKSSILHSALATNLSAI